MATIEIEDTAQTDHTQGHVSPGAGLCWVLAICVFAGCVWVHVSPLLFEYVGLTCPVPTHDAPANRPPEPTYYDLLIHEERSVCSFAPWRNCAWWWMWNPDKCKWHVVWQTSTPQPMCDIPVHIVPPPIHRLAGTTPRCCDCR